MILLKPTFLRSIYFPMKRFLFSLILLGNVSLFAQDKKSADFVGIYQVEFYPSRKMKVAWENDRLSFELVGQGKTVLEPLKANIYSVKGIPNSTIEFIQDSIGKTIRFVWNHNPFKGVWSRISETPGSPVSSADNLQPYSGKYVVKGNVYRIVEILAEKDHLIGKIPGEQGLAYYPNTKNNFVFK